MLIGTEDTDSAVLVVDTGGFCAREPMKKNLALRQERMRERAEREAANPPKLVPLTYELPRYVSNPVDYSKPVAYLTTDVELLQFWPKACGVYLLCEDGRYYIGQSIDVPARYASHRLKAISSKFRDPRCVILAKVPFHEGWSLSRNEHTRLNAEARFLSAALQMEMPLTNTDLTEFRRAKLIKMFTDVSEERVRLEKALEILR